MIAADWLDTPIMIALSIGIAASGLMLLWRSGLISFGHGLYLGVGAYSVAILNQWYGVSSVFAALAVGGFLAGLTGAVIGVLIQRYRGIFFAMLNLAFSMVLYGYLVNSNMFGSTEGLSVSPGTLLGIDLVTSEGHDKRLVLLVVVLCFLVTIFVEVWRHSVMGWLGRSIRDNEVRVQYLGYSVAQTVFVTYLISAVATGLAGVVLALSIGQVDPGSMVNWTASGDLVFATVLGGTGSALAPVLGGFCYEAIHSTSMQLFPSSWGLVMGVAIVAIIMALPTGLWSVIRRIIKARVFSVKKVEQ